jgi:foldase protein PrsA
VRRSLKAATATGFLAVGLLAGCSHPFHAGAAAVVGDERISTDQLRTMVDRGLAGVPATATTKPKASDVQNVDLTQLIQLAVLKHMASDYKIPTVTQAQIDGELTKAAASNSATQAELEANAASQGVDPTTLRTFAEVVAYQDAIVASAPVAPEKIAAAYESAKASTFDEVHVAHILVATKALADSIAAQLKADPTKFAALAKQYSTDTDTKDKGGDLGFGNRGAFVQEFSDAAFAGADGSIVGPVQSQYGFHIIDVIAHRTVSLADATPTIRQQINATTFVATFKKAAKDLGVSVNPRFGSWNPDGGNSQLGAVQASDAGDLSSPVGSPSASTPASGEPAPSATDSSSP